MARWYVGVVLVCCLSCGTSEKPARTTAYVTRISPAASAVAAEEPALASPGGRLLVAIELPKRGALDAHSLHVLADGGTIVSGLYSETIDLGGGDLPSFSQQDPASYGVRAGETAGGIFVALHDARGRHVSSRGWGPNFGQSPALVAGRAKRSLVIAMGVKGKIALEGKPVRSVDRDIFLSRLGMDAAPTASRRIGGAGDQSVSALATDAADDTFIAGEFQRELDFGSKKLEGSGTFVAKLARDGKLVFSHTLDERTIVAALSVAKDGSLFAGGYFLHRAADVDIDIGAGFIVRYDAAGVPKFRRELGNVDGSTSVDDVAATPDGGVVIAGSYDGKQSWYDLPVTDDATAFVASFDRQGVPRWAHTLTSPSHDSSGGVAVDARGNVAWTGTCGDDAVIAKTSVPCSSPHGGEGDGNAFVATFDRAGNLRWARAFGDEELQSGDRVAFAPTGEVIVLVNGWGGFQLDHASFAHSTLPRAWLLRFTP